MPKWPRVSLRSLLLIACAWIASRQLTLFFGVHSGHCEKRHSIGAIYPMHRPTFILFGDSITQQSFDLGGWGARLAHRYARKADVVLRGYSGYNTAWALQLLPKVFPVISPVQPTLVTVFFGANDAALAGGVNERQHVPLVMYAENLRTIVRHLRSCGANVTVIITPPPVNEPARIIARKEKWGSNEHSEQPDRLNSVTGQYAAVCRAVAAESGVQSLDIWTGLQEDPKWREFLSDGLHLTPRGNEVVYQMLQRLIDEKLPHLRFENMRFDFPLHDQISTEDPAAAFAALP